MRNFAWAAVVVALAACSQEKTPSDHLKDAAGDLVDEAADMVSASKPQGRFAPRDECGILPGYSEFREALESAVAKRDAKSLAAIADPKIKLDFGGGGGRAELQSRLSGAELPLWEELDEILDLGCAVNAPNSTSMPWYFAQDMGDVDP